jgi:hypothetical protein
MVMRVMTKIMLRKERSMRSTQSCSRDKRMEVKGKRRNLTSIETN